MSGIAVFQCPFTWASPAVELAGGMWRKKVLPVGEIDYNGRTLRFTPDYIRGLEKAFRNRAYDYVPLQLADSGNNHTNDPERFRGTIVDMQAEDDGLYVLVEPTERGEQVLRENPNLGVSCRIVEQYARADGKFYPAAVQHVLATHDPRITSLGPWQQADLSNGGPGIVIDLSGSRFPGDEPPAGGDELTDAELRDIIDVMAEAGAGDYGGELTGDGLAAWVDSLSDDELDQLAAEAESDGALGAAAGDFDTAFSGHLVTQAEREQADLEDMIRPAVRAEDKLAQSLARLADGTHPALGLANPAAAAIELSARSLSGICGAPDEFGGCGSRYHALGCSAVASSGENTELAGSGAYGAALDGLELSLADDGRDGELVPRRTIELAGRITAMVPALLDPSGMHGYVPSSPEWDDLLGSSRQVDAYSAMADELGRPGLADPQPDFAGYPDVSALRAELGL